MQPMMNGLPSGAVAGKSEAFGHCSENASPAGTGCVVAVLLKPFCGTAFSSICVIGLPVARSSSYNQPVLHGSATAFVILPATIVLNMTVGDGQSQSQRSW